MCLSILPHNDVQKAVALCFAEIISKNGKLRGETPYAYAFCRYAFGASKPTRSKLLILAASSYDNVPEIMRKLDLFLRSNGQRQYCVDDYYAKRMFPSLDNKIENRQENHINMVMERRCKIDTKRSEIKLAERTIELKKLKSEVLTLDKSKLCQWVREREDEVNKTDLIACLNLWFDKNISGNWSFYDLYHSMNPSRIALDLSWEDEEIATNEPDDYFF